MSYTNRRILYYFTTRGRQMDVRWTLTAMTVVTCLNINAVAWSWSSSDAGANRTVTRGWWACDGGGGDGNWTADWSRRQWCPCNCVCRRTAQYSVDRARHVTRSDYIAVCQRSRLQFVSRWQFTADRAVVCYQFSGLSA